MTTLRIDDLTDPVLTDDQRATLTALDGIDLDFSAEALLASAARATRLREADVVGDDLTFHDRLEAHLAAIRSDEGLSGLGRFVLHQRVKRLLRQRALLNELLARHPEIHQIELPTPVVVVGLPRSGTTHLVNLLAADPRRRALPYWESQEPFPGPGDGPGPDGLDPRYLRAEAEHRAGAAMAPLTRAMHDRYPGAIEEECELLDLDLAGYTLEWHARVPSWRDHLATLDQNRHYAHLRTVLQALTFLRGPRRWVLKCPQHLENLGALMGAFPDAVVVQTHRDPVAVVTSAVTMLAYGDRIRRHAIEPAQLLDYWADRVERLLRAGLRDRDLVPETQLLDVPFEQILADDLGVVARVHELTGDGLPDDVLQAVQHYRDDNRRGKHGQIAYDLAGDFGTTPTELAERFSFYTERFGLPAGS